MIKKVYSDFESRVNEARAFMGRPLTYSEKILYAHLFPSQAKKHLKEEILCRFRSG
jgi:aconitate hydratase